MAREIRVNRIKLSDLPKIYGFEAFEGNDAFGIFSSGEVIGEVASAADRLGVDLAETEGTDLPRRLSEALESEDNDIKREAEHLAAGLGRRLGLIFYVLKRDTAMTLKANPWYSAEDFDLWHSIRSIYLVGGLANGNLGKTLAKYACEVLYELGVDGVSVKTGLYPSHAQLVGIARLTDGAKKALLFDFGHTFVKSAVASFEDGKLAELAIRPKVPSQYMGRGFANEDEEKKDALRLHGFIVDIISAGILAFNEELSYTVAVSIANNVTDGRINGGGCYCKLRRLGENYADILSAAVSAQVGREIKIVLVHDGKAAALCFDEEENAVAVALGTAFGVGYTEGRHDLCAVSEDLLISS